MCLKVRSCQVCLSSDVTLHCSLTLTSGCTRLTLWHTKPSLQWKERNFLPFLYLVFCVNNAQQSIFSVLEEEKDRDVDFGSSAFSRHHRPCSPQACAAKSQQAWWRWHILLSKTWWDWQHSLVQCYNLEWEGRTERSARRRHRACSSFLVDSCSHSFT